MNSAEVLSDENLYGKFISGDTKSYDQLMIRYGDSLTLYLYGYLQDWHDAEDMMIEAFARIMVKKPRISAGNFKAYLYKTGRNLAFRFHSRKHRAVVFSLEDYDQDSEGSGLIDELVRSEERKRALHVCLTRIDPQLREALWLVYFEGLSYKEAAEIMRISTKKIDHLLTRGKQKMREELEKEGITDAN